MSESPAATNAESNSGLACTVLNAAKELNVGQSTIWKLIREGRIKSFKVYDRRLIPRTELNRIVAEAA